MFSCNSRIVPNKSCTDTCRRKSMCMCTYSSGLDRRMQKQDTSIALSATVRRPPPVFRPENSQPQLCYIGRTTVKYKTETPARAANCGPTSTTATKPLTVSFSAMPEPARQWRRRAPPPPSGGRWWGRATSTDKAGGGALRGSPEEGSYHHLPTEMTSVQVLAHPGNLNPFSHLVHISVSIANIPCWYLYF